MKARDALELFVLGAIWGASFLFMRIAVPAFGPVALIEARVAIASVFLVAFLTFAGGLAKLRAHFGALLVVGVTSSALPFSLLAYATLTVTAGYAAMLNATAPLWSALVAFVWLGMRLSVWRMAGLAVGFAGVTILVWGKASFAEGGNGLAILAGLVATLLYGIAANYTKQKLSAVEPLVIAAGSQLAAALILLPFALWAWPAAPISVEAWISVVIMGIGSTAIAYILYFRLIVHLGAAKAITVAFLIPLFAVLWGYVFLGEPLSAQMALGGAVILAGTALSTGLLDASIARLSRRRD